MGTLCTVIKGYTNKNKITLIKKKLSILILLYLLLCKFDYVIKN